MDRSKLLLFLSFFFFFFFFLSFFFFFFNHLSILRFEPWCALAGVSACVHPLVGLGGEWGQNVTKHYVTYNGNPPPPPPPKKKKKKKKEEEVRDDDSDTDSDNEMLMKSETKWPRILIVETVSEDLTLQKLSPFAVQKGSQAIAGSFLDTKD